MSLRGPYRQTLLAGLLCAFLCAPVAHAADLPAPPDGGFGAPVDCPADIQCIVQNYVDHAPGPGYKDHRCRSLTYDGHNGIDIRLPTVAEMEDGVPVVAAADGEVLRTRDGMPDVSMRRITPESLKGREAGNGIVIRHENGWTTQYSHLRRGSVRVRPGDKVSRGDSLGLIGLSGKTEFPHVEFTLRHDHRPIDPYTGRPPESGCEQEPRPLWSAEAARTLAYRAGGLLKAGFAPQPPRESDDIVTGHFGRDAVTTEAPALVFWIVSWGLAKGDRERVALTGPEGATIAGGETEVPRDKAQWMRFIGRKRPSGGWPTGVYRGTYTVERTDEAGSISVVVDAERTIELR